ncbi:Crp/Fnr family transcriptional regulator [Enterovibrio coralii]|uniref:Crp/Fnr family transcriptional regulator n=1 Tax=Enterovibrio coralii TaxID=294935 RepID=A0A135I8K7_9GAMM|nr:Crp/Fnr family transcriptional regulator [Enterovibrio coralii]KXF81789.1 Crp/Fnr family transcriptional regulator [Enterovibrio coralii]
MKLSPYPFGRFRDPLAQKEMQLRQLIAQCITHTRYFQAGEALLRQGEKLEHVFIVPVGCVSMSITSENGRRFQLGRSQCDDHVFGEMEFFTQQPCQWTVIADEALQAEVVCISSLTKQLLKHPELLLYFASALAADFQDSMAIYTSRLLHSITYNIAMDLLNSKETTVSLVGFDKVSQEAERFGTTSRVYRRAVKELVDKGLIAKEEGRLIVINEPALRDYLALHG